MSAAAEDHAGLRTTVRSTVHLDLDSDLVARAAAFSPDLSATIEDLLADFMSRGETRQRSEGELDDVLAAINAHHERHGFLSDEFSKL